MKATLARFTLDECTTLATEVLRLRTTGEVRSLLTTRVAQDGAAPAERVVP